MTRVAMLATAAAAVLTLTVGGWAAAGASRPAAPETPRDGRGLQLRYEVRREPAYVPPPPSEATRLEVMDARSPTVIEDGVLSAQAGEALRSLQTDDAARTAAALAAVRVEDSRIDRETAKALKASADDQPASAETESSERS